MALALHPIASAAELPSVPWANGAGSTIELVSLDASAQLTPDLPRWRASIATLEQPSEFSALPGVRRIFRPIGSDLVLLSSTAPAMQSPTARPASSTARR